MHHHDRLPQQRLGEHNCEHGRSKQNAIKSRLTMKDVATKASITEIEERLSGPLFESDPHEAFRVLRESAPIYWSETRGHWLVTSMDLVAEVLGDPASFSSVGFESKRIDRLPNEVAQHAKGVADHFSVLQMVSSDPPDHTRIRRAFGAGFLPRKVGPLAPMMRDSADRLLDQADKEMPDIVTDLAEPLPVEVVSEIVGVPRETRARIPHVTLDQREFFGAANLTVDNADRFTHSLDEWDTLLRSWMAERRNEPRDDVITRASEMVMEERITESEAVATLLHLVIAGNGTTTALISTATFHILRHREQAAMLVADRDLIPNAVEEALRFEAPLPTDRRIATEEVSIGGQTIAKGDVVMSVLAAANRDPAHFRDPNLFDVTREFNQKHHVAFGRGIHLCLGAPVARLETAVALEAIFDRYGAAEIPAGFEPSWHAIATHRGLRSLPIHPVPS